MKALCLEDLPPERAPVGETTQNRSGTDLLEMCDELDLYSHRPDNGCRSTDRRGQHC
jgi:hypothetical protein